MVSPRPRSSCVKPPLPNPGLLVVVVVVRGTSFAAPIARFFSLFCSRRMRPEMRTYMLVASSP